MKYPAREWPRCARCQKPGHPDRRVEHEGKVYCSSSCVESLQEEVSTNTLRVHVLARDKGVCAACGLDTIELRAELGALLHNTWTGLEAVRRCRARILQLVRLGFDEHAVEKGHALWEMAHVDARVRGGANVLGNVVTWCLACHKADSKKLAAERAASRRPRRFGR